MPERPYTATKFHCWNIAISEKTDRFQLIGERGAMVRNLITPFEMSAQNFDFVILQLSANDIAAGQNAC